MLGIHTRSSPRIFRIATSNKSFPAATFSQQSKHPHLILLTMNDNKPNDELAHEAAQTIIEMDAAVRHTPRDFQHYTD